MPSPLPVTGTLPESWRVRLPIFEGPLDLLLHLIRVNEVEITDIPVALICDQFHEYLNLMEVLNLDVAGDYIYMAAYLIHLKSKMLLPRPRTLEGKEIDEDPRQDLVERLLEYQRLKDAAQVLAEVDSVRRGMLVRRGDEMQRISADEEPALDLSELSLFDLLRSFREVLDRWEKEHPEPMHLTAEVYSVRQQIERLLARLRLGRPYDLIDDLRALSCRAEAIAAFLAVLEMARMLLIRLHQTEQGAVLLYRTDRELLASELEAVQG
ncbi:MAG TPA: segregation/condensation protein A [Thermoanaerobaculia bacterium]|jgi:segregation and condensation protein A